MKRETRGKGCPFKVKSESIENKPPLELTLLE
jgi:hypothetical protein